MNMINMGTLSPADRLNGDNININTATVAEIRSIASIAAGIAAGVMGLESLYGVLFFLVTSLVVTGIILLMANFEYKIYFQTWSGVVLDGVDGALMSFVLFWTLFYDICHIYS